jgi:hypothetical protein
MNELALIRVPATTAAEACALAKLPPPALALLTPEQTSRQFLDALLMRELYPEAIRFLAFAMPPREAVWWACLCVRLTQPALPPPQDQALSAATRWAAEPTEPHRQAAEPLAATSSAAGYSAKAVAWTGGSLLPPSMKPLKPGPELPHEAVFAAVSLAVTSVAPDKVSEARRHALALGVNVAKGKHLWPHHGAERPAHAPPHAHLPSGVRPRPRFS